MMPTHSATNMRYKIDPPDYVIIDGGTVLAGMVVLDADFNRNAEQKKNPQRIEITNIAGYQHVDLKWIVKGGTKYTIKVESVKGGRASGQAE
jgi:hypothetical protein